MSPNCHEGAVSQQPVRTQSTTRHDIESIYSVSTANEQPEFHQVLPIISTHDTPIQHYSSHGEVPDEVYDRLSPSRKTVIVALLSFCSFLAPISSTAILAAIPEVATTYRSSGRIINLSNALYMLFMGLSPCFWGPLSQVYGRRRICLVSAALFCGCSLGTALAPNLPAYFVFRILTAFEGTSLINVGASCIGDIYQPTERATAMGWLLSGTLIGPAFGPFIGGIIVTFQSWRVIFYLQTALAGVALVGAYFLLPETAHHMKADELVGLPLKAKAQVLGRMLNPWRVVRLYRYPNLIVASAAAASLVFNMYILLTPIRYVLNPRFGLSTALASGLFYLAPGCGYLLGSLAGGRYADHVAVQWRARRGGVRVPEDRLRAAVPFMGVVVPGCTLLYGWAVQARFGGVALPVVMMFGQGVGQLFCFPSLNTYCLDVMQSRGAEVIAGNYMTRYLLAAVASAVVLPAVEQIGVGWVSTISAAFLVGSGLATCAAARSGPAWRDKIDLKRRAARRAKTMHAAEADSEEKDGLEKEKGAVAVGGKQKDVV